MHALCVQLPWLKEILKADVRHSSTNFFRRAEIFARKVLANNYSEPEGAALSSAEDVTVARVMQVEF
jgi:hypothetical protein